MSWRISLDAPRAGYDFNVGVDGTIEQAIAKYRWHSPVKIAFEHDASLWSFLLQWFALADWDNISSCFRITNGESVVLPESEYDALRDAALKAEIERFVAANRGWKDSE